MPCWGPVFRLHYSTGVACAILLWLCGLPSVGDARPDQPQAKLSTSVTRSERSIHKALTEGALLHARQLINQGANIEARNSQGATPLITAAGRGNLTLVTLLLNQQARVEATDRAGNTALHEASLYGRADCVEVLLTTGAQTSTRNALTFTPLHQAVRRFWELSGESRADRLAQQAKVIGILLRHGADPELKDVNGRTPLTLAVESNNGSLRHAFKHSLPEAGTTVTVAAPPPSPAAQPQTSRSVATPPALAQRTDASAVPNDDPAPSQSVEHPRPLPSPAPQPTMASTESTESDRTATLTPRTAPRESPSKPPSGEPLPPATHIPPAATTSAGVPAPQLTPPIATPNMATASPSPSTPPEPLHTHSQLPPLTSESPLPRTVDMPPVSQVAALPNAANPDVLTPSSTTPPASAEPRAQHLQMNQATISSPAPPTDTRDSRPDAPPSPEPPSRSLAPTIEPVEERRTPRRPPQFIPAGEPTPPPSTPPTATSDTSVRTVPTLQLNASSPPTDRGAAPSVTPATDRTDESPPADEHRPWLFQSLGFGLGLGWTHNLGPRRVDSVTVVNGIVRIDNERNDLVRFMPEMHLWIDRWDEQRWSWGPFLTVAPGSRVIDAVGFGLMMGYRPHRQDQYSFNLGIGGTLDLDTRVLGDGLIANEPLPPRETTARTKQTTAAGLLVLFSVGWDLAAPHRVSPHD